MTKQTEIELILREFVEAGQIEPYFDEVDYQVTEKAIQALIDTACVEAVKETEKAFGGCKKCYGKGYATVIEYSEGYDTDQDIGSKGGHIKYQNPIIKYCTCERGKQLEKLTNQEKSIDNKEQSE